MEASFNRCKRTEDLAGDFFKQLSAKLKLVLLIQSLPNCSTVSANVPFKTKHIVCPYVKFSGSSSLIYQDESSIFCKLFLLQWLFYDCKFSGWNAFSMSASVPLSKGVKSSTKPTLPIGWHWFISFSSLRSEHCKHTNCTVADVKSTTSKIKYYKTKQYSTIKKTGFTTNTKKTKKYWWTSKPAKHQEASMNYMLNMNKTSFCSHSDHVQITLLLSLLDAN